MSRLALSACSHVKLPKMQQYNEKNNLKKVKKATKDKPTLSNTLMVYNNGKKKQRVFIQARI
jgi:hypothetical protein